MKIFLFGGAEVNRGQVEPLLKLIEEVMLQLKAKQILHIPFARTESSDIEWRGDWFNKYIHLKGADYLNAQNTEDIAKAQSPLIFISGGSNSANLLKKIQSNPQLVKLIRNAQYIIGESAGGKVLATHFRSTSGQGKSTLRRGLGIIKDTIIEPHYTERNRQELLEREMKKTHSCYGLGIDCVTGMELDTDTFPAGYKKIGNGSAEIKVNPAKASN